MMDQVERVYLRKVSSTSNNREKNGTLDSAFFQFHWEWKSEIKIKNVGKPKHIQGVRVEFVENEISLSRSQCIEESVRSFSFHKGHKV